MAWIVIKIALRFVPKGLIDNNPAFFKPKLTRFSGEYMRQKGEMS